MHFLISPAKTLDFDTPMPPTTPPATSPRHTARAAQLIGLLRSKSADEVARLMDISSALAELNVARYADWSPRATARNSKPAALAFNGDVYEGWDAPTLGADDLAWAQVHVSILSGLYGVLRPLDRLQPYRLEMGTALAGDHGRHLYDFWGDTVAQHLNRCVAADPVPVIVNLASQEYFKVVQRPALKPRVIECVFEEWKAGQYKVISFFAKRARGLMLRHAVLRRCAVPEDLTAFDSEGYAFDAAASEPARLVFRRRVEGGGA